VLATSVTGIFKVVTEFQEGIPKLGNVFIPGFDKVTPVPIDSLKVTVISVIAALTPVASLAGTRVITVGAVVSGATASSELVSSSSHDEKIKTKETKTNRNTP
jgi:hypothetical protein